MTGDLGDPRAPSDSIQEFREVPISRPSLLESDRLRLVVDSMSEGFGLLAPDFTILELNHAAMRIDARRREDVIGQSHWLAYPGTEHSDVGRLYKKAMRDRVAVELEHRYDWPDGRQSWFETRAFPMSDGCLAVFFRDVSERRLSEERLGRSERRFKAAVSGIDGVLWTTDADGKMTGEQSGWTALTGQALEDYQGHGWSQAVHADDARPTLEAWQSAVAAQKPFVFEHRVKRHDGQWRLFAVRAIPLVEETGKIGEWVGVHRDITDTRAGERRLHQLAETIDEVFYVHEVDEGRIAYVSRAYEKVWGRPRAELYADLRSFTNVVHPDDRPKLDAAMSRQLAGQDTDTEYRLRSDDGGERIIHDRAFVTRDPVSNGLRVVGLAADITEHRRAQALLARNAETFAHLVASNPFGIYVVDADFRLTQISQGARAVFSTVYNPIGRDLAEVLHILWRDPFATEVIDIFRRTLATGEPYISHSTIERRADIGKVEAYDWRTERLVLPDGRFGVVCYFYDLSERNSYEEKLKQALADKDLLAREIDHRVKNSLAVVGSLLSMQRGLSSSEETHEALEEAADRVLAVARVHQQLHKSHQLGFVAFADYLKELCSDLSVSMRRRGVTLNFKAVPVDLPAEPAMSLALIANELVTNAFKHGCAAGATAISVSLEQDADDLILTVSDNGAGLPTTTTGPRASLGFKLIDALARQLSATPMFPQPGSPAVFSLRVPNSVLAASAP